MNYETQIAPRLANNETPAEIAVAINAEHRANASHYRPVAANEVIDWLATDALSVRLEEWFTAESAKAVEDRHPAYAQLAAGFKGLLAMQANTAATLKVPPGSPHRTQIEAAIALGVMQASDLTRLDAIAYRGPTETAESVQGVIDNHNSLAAWWGRVVKAGALLVESHTAETPVTQQAVIDAIAGVV